MKVLFLPETVLKLKNLTGHTPYRVSISAFNAAGDGPRSDPRQGRTHQAGRRAACSAGAPSPRPRVAEPGWMSAPPPRPHGPLLCPACDARLSCARGFLERKAWVAFSCFPQCPALACCAAAPVRRHLFPEDPPGSPRAGGLRLRTQASFRFPRGASCWGSAPACPDPGGSEFFVRRAQATASGASRVAGFQGHTRNSLQPLLRHPPPARREHCTATCLAACGPTSTHTARGSLCRECQLPSG